MWSNVTIHVVGLGMDIVGMILTHETMTDFGAKINQMGCSVNPTVTCPWGAPLRRENPTYQAPTLLDGMGWGVGVFAGVLISPAPWLITRWHDLQSCTIATPSSDSWLPP